MTIREFQETVEYNIEHNLKHAILGLGAPGLGKSQAVMQIGKRLGYKVIDIRLAQMSEVEIGGLIYPNASRTKTVWLAPEVLPNEERDGKKTILLLDEITSCSKRVQVAAYQLILDRRIGQYTLPEGTFVVALGNTEDDDGVYIQLAGPLADRFEIHYIDTDFDCWRFDYAEKYGIHPYVIDYLTFKPSALHNQKEADGAYVFATPRSWERVSDILKFDADISKRVIQNKIIGNVGELEGRQFIEYCRTHAGKVTADGFVSGQMDAPNSPDEINLLIKAMVDNLQFLSGVDSVDKLSRIQFLRVQDTIHAFFKFDRAEYTMIGCKRLMMVNRLVVKDILLGLDDSRIVEFIQNNSQVLGLK